MTEKLKELGIDVIDEKTGTFKGIREILEDLRSKNVEVMQIYKNYFTAYIKRPGAADLLQWMECNGFFEAPASCRHHGAEPGGLAEHSINVFRRLLWIAEDGRGQQEAPDMESIAVVSLLHDLCKIDAYRATKRDEILQT